MPEETVQYGVNEAPRQELVAREVVNPVIENKIKPIEIRQVNRGYIVSVGCSTFAFSTKEELIVKLEDYIHEPAQTEKKWFDGELFKTS